MALKESPSQTAGPYVHIGCLPGAAGLDPRGRGPELGATLVHDPNLAAISLAISIVDGADEPVTDAMIEIWHANPNGTYNFDNSFSGWGRQATDATTGTALFTTLKPGAVEDQAPHVLIWIAARGINLALTTRLYFPDEKNQGDPVLELSGARAETLIAQRTETGYAHVIHLQGPNETVFLDV